MQAANQNNRQLAKNIDNVAYFCIYQFGLECANLQQLPKLVMQDNDEINQKRSEFRSHIRRKQINERFVQYRIKFAEDLIRNEQDCIMKQVDTPAKKKQWLLAKSQQLGNTPDLKWFQILRTLSISLPAFKDDLSDWISTGIIFRLVQLFKQKYKDLDLSVISACIMQDIFYYLPESGPQVQQILEYEFMLDLVELCASSQATSQHYYELIVNMIDGRGYLRNGFIDCGIVQILSTRMKTYKDLNTDEVVCALSLVYRLVKKYQVKGGELLPKGNVIAILIPILDSYLPLLTREQSISLALKSFCMLSSFERGYTLAHLFESPHLKDYLLSTIMKEGHPIHRSLGTAIIASILSSSNQSYAQKFVEMGVLDSLLKCTRLKNNTQNCINSILRIISNIVANTKDEAIKVVNHEIFSEFVIAHAKNTEDSVNNVLTKSSNQSAIFALATLLHYRNFGLTDLLLRKYSLLQIFVQSLNNPIPRVENVLQILQAMIHLINFYNSIYTGSQNKILYELESMYNFETVLNQLQEKICKNSKIRSRIEIIRNFMMQDNHYQI